MPLSYRLYDSIRLSVFVNKICYLILSLFNFLPPFNTNEKWKSIKNCIAQIIITGKFGPARFLRSNYAKPSYYLRRLSFLICLEQNLPYGLQLKLIMSQCQNVHLKAKTLNADGSEMDQYGSLLYLSNLKIKKNKNPVDGALRNILKLLYLE